MRNVGKNIPENREYQITARELAELGPDHIPDAFIPGKHLIYSSPATLSYNSPGALGFGVKRAALTIPESVELLLSPLCCGRNSTILSSEEGYADRMFYLTIDETDLVTGLHIEKVPEAVREILDVCSPKPKVVLICITCVDALLGTDLDSLCRTVTEETGVTAVPCRMNALAREGRKPPMTEIRDTVYSLLKLRPKQADAVNLLGYFMPVSSRSELVPLLKKAGLRTVNEVSRCRTLSEYEKMASANFNLVLHPESRYAAERLRKRLGLPYIEFPRLFSPEKIHKMYYLLGNAIGVHFSDQEFYEKALEERRSFQNEFRGAVFSVGEMIDADPYELSASLAESGMIVKDIFSNLTQDQFPFLRRLAEASPDTVIRTGIAPSMIHYEDAGGVDFAVGKDAAGYHPSAVLCPWKNAEEEPFGFQGYCDFVQEVRERAAEAGMRRAECIGTERKGGRL